MQATISGPIAVVAPHPDDDAIGCGGTLARAAARGVRVDAFYVTDGSASHPNSQRFPPAALRDIREREARAGLRLLGVHTEPCFLRVPDGTLAHLDAREHRELARRLTSAFRSGGYGVVLGPWLRDPHPDHFASATLVAQAVAALECPPCLLGYTVWLHEFGRPEDRPPPGHPRVDVVLSANELALKRAAILAHASQTTALIDDDPSGFRISAAQLDRWLRPDERFYVIDPANVGTNVA
jgi:LmbE family N-acetylglucosaminyl deacetylase